MPRFRTSSVSVLLCLLLMIGATSAAFAAEQGGRGLHKKLYVTPAPANIKIDGDLSDWDLSGQIMSYVIPETADVQNSRVAMMYDKEALYISGVVADDSPMMNRHDPAVNPRKAWNADVCQIFLSLDPDAQLPLSWSRFNKAHAVSPVSTIFMWYYTDGKQPNLAMYYGMGFREPVRKDLHEEGLVPQTHFDAAYAKSEDGKSYTFEYRIPWSTLSVKRVPTAGDEMAGSLCVFWGKPDGLETAGAAAWVNDVMSLAGFPFQESRVWGTLVFSPTNNIPKVMVEGEAKPEMRKLLTIDYELPVDGEVTLQLVDENKTIRRILLAQAHRKAGKHKEMWDGLDDKGEPLPEGQYKVQMLTHGPIEAQWRLSVHNSGTPPWPTDDGTGGWGGDHGSPTTVAALPDGMLLAWRVSEFGWGIIRTDLDGKKIWGSKHNAQHLATDGKRYFAAGGHGFHLGADAVRLFAVKDGRPLNFSNGQPALMLPASLKSTEASAVETYDDAEEEDHARGAVTGLAYCEGNIYVSYASLDLIGVFDANTGELVKQLKTDSPHALAAANDSLFWIRQKDEHDSEIVKAKLEKFGDKPGNDFVVFVNNTAGDHVPDHPTGLAADKAGNVYVSNQGQSNDVTVYDANGKYLRTLGKPGGRPAKGRYDKEGMYKPGGIDIDARGRLWVAETVDGPKRISVWDTNTGRNLAEYFGGSSYFGYGYIDPAKPDEIYAHHVMWAIDWDQYKGVPTTTIWRKTAPNMMDPPSPSGYQGTIRIFTTDRGHQYLWGISRPGKVILTQRDGDLFKPFAATINHPLGDKRYKGQKIPVIDDDAETFPRGLYFWQDANNDQSVQADEVTRFADGAQRKNLRITWVNPDLSLVFTTGQMLKPVSVDAKGRPRYDITQLENSFLNGNEAFEKNYANIWRSPEGDTYTHGSNLAGFDPSGQLVWKYPDLIPWRKSLNKPIVGPGRMWAISGPLGATDNYTGLMTYFGVNHIFTSDGVYVAALLRDSRLTGMGPDKGQPEGQHGQFVKLNIQGKDRYFIIHGGQDSRVWEVMGLDTVKRLPDTTLSITTDDLKRAKAEYDAYELAMAQGQPLVIAKGKDALDDARPVVARVDQDNAFEARAAYDQKNLYLRYDVTASSPLVNQMSEPQLIFKGGNLIDVQLAADPKADPSRKTPAPGDVRLLISRRDGKVIAMRYRPRIQGHTGKRIKLTSVTGEESFDSIDAVNGIAVDVKPNTDKRSGMRVDVTIPLTLLGWDPSASDTVLMDLGYVFGNEQGLVTAARAYWHNQGFSAYVTNDVPNESRLTPREWGQAMLEK